MSVIDPGETYDVGVRIDLHPVDTQDWVHLQRSDDGTTSTIEREWKVPGVQSQLFDPVSPTAGTKFYRTRGIGLSTCTSPSTWTNWRQAKAAPRVNVPREPKPVGQEMRWRGGSSRTMDDVGHWGGSQVISATTVGHELYSYDSSTGAGGVKVGARKGGTTGVGANAEDFDIKKGGELVTVPGSEFSATADTKYFVYFRSTAAGVSGTQTKSTALNWDRVFLGSITSAPDGSTGTSSSTGPPEAV